MALTDLLLGGLLTMGGGAVTVGLTARFERLRDKRRYEHERLMAKDERQQERLGTTYVELLAYLSHQRGWAESVRPLFDTPKPEPFDRARHDEIEAKVTAFGSPRVRELLREWGECARKIEDADWTIEYERSAPDPSQGASQDAANEKKLLPGYKQKVSDADDRIRLQVNAELSGCHDGRAEPEQQ